jgi:hypothetical protein
MKAADQNQNAANTPAAMAELFSVPYFGKVPMDPNMMFACENGFSFLENFPILQLRVLFLQLSTSLLLLQNAIQLSDSTGFRHQYLRMLLSCSVQL